jgi:hypothetical protein
MDSAGSRWDPVASAFERGNKHSGYRKVELLDHMSNCQVLKIPCSMTLLSS